MKKKIEIELTEKEAGHLRTLLEGGIKISDSISQGEVFKNILDHLNSQDQEGCEKRIRIRGELSGETEHIKAHKEYLATSKQDAPEEWRELFAEWGLWSLVEDISDDGDGQGDNLQLTKEGREAYRMIKGLLDEREYRAREEGRREVLNKETFIGDYDILMQGLHIRTIDRENFLAQIYKTVKERYDWAFGTATYKQALKMIENSLTSPLTPYVGTDKMIDEARIEVLSKLTTK